MIQGRLAGIVVSDTAGCSAAQIIEAAGLGEGHLHRGITRSALLDWIDLHRVTRLGVLSSAELEQWLALRADFARGIS